jgi:prepilin-type N-terminal cleavage/methylation domain-containing protein
MKQKSPNNPSTKYQVPSTHLGFTLIEMLVVISILGLFAAAVMANFAAQRGPRNLRIAQNELVTNIRKVQSQALASRNSSLSGKAVKYYVLQFDRTNPSQYLIQAVADDLTLDTPVETINFPANISISVESSLVLEQPVGASATKQDCVQVTFALPYGTMYLDPSCQILTTIASSGGLASVANSALTIVLTESVTGDTRSVNINGVSGVITTP